MKTLSENTLQAYKVARRMGATLNKRVICPGCGRVQSMDGVLFALKVDAGHVIPAQNTEKADGVQWCALCA